MKHDKSVYGHEGRVQICENEYERWKTRSTKVQDWRIERGTNERGRIMLGGIRAIRHYTTVPITLSSTLLNI